MQIEPDPEDAAPERRPLAPGGLDLIGDCLRARLKTASAAPSVRPERRGHEGRVMRLGGATAEIGTPAMIGIIAVEEAEALGSVALQSALAWHLADTAPGGSAAEPGRSVNQH